MMMMLVIIIIFILDQFSTVVFHSSNFNQQRWKIVALLLWSPKEKKMLMT